MKIYKYKDKELKKELEILDLGILPAGEKKQYTFYVYNETFAKYTSLEFIIEHSEVKIIKFPKELNSKEKGILVIEWNPLVELRQGLKVELKIKGYELWKW